MIFAAREVPNSVHQIVQEDEEREGREATVVLSSNKTLLVRNNIQELVELQSVWALKILIIINNRAQLLQAGQNEQFHLSERVKDTLQVLPKLMIV